MAAKKGFEPPGCGRRANKGLRVRASSSEIKYSWETGGEEGIRTVLAEPGEQRLEGSDTDLELRGEKILAEGEGFEPPRAKGAQTKN